MFRKLAAEFPALCKQRVAEQTNLIKKWRGGYRRWLCLERGVVIVMKGKCAKNADIDAAPNVFNDTVEAKTISSARQANIFRRQKIFLRRLKSQVNIPVRHFSTVTGDGVSDKRFKIVDVLKTKIISGAGAGTHLCV